MHENTGTAGAGSFVYNAQVSSPYNMQASPQKSYFGLSALVIAFISDIFLLASFVITVMDITPAQFFTLNNITNLVYCFTAPLALGLGAWSFRRRNDTTGFSVLAMLLVFLPFAVLLWNFVNALFLSN
jgi:hypothetical protein